MMPKNKKKKKFVDLNIIEEKVNFHIHKFGSINDLHNFRLISKIEYDYFIINEDFKRIFIYNKKNIKLLQEIEKYNLACYILNESNFLIYISEDTIEIYAKSEGIFKYLKRKNFPRINKDIIYTKKNKIIISTERNIQIWDIKNKIPNNCISYIKLIPRILFLMNNEKILVTAEKCQISFWDMNNIKLINCYKFCNDNFLIYIVKKFDEKNILINEIIDSYEGCYCPNCSSKINYCENMGIVPDNYLIELPKLKEKKYLELSDDTIIFNKPIYNILTFQKKNLVILSTKKNFILYNYAINKEIKKYKTNDDFIAFEKLKENCFAKIYNNKIEFYEII